MEKKITDLLITDKMFGIEKTKRMGPRTMLSHHYHDHYEIFYLLSGERHYFIHDRTYNIKKGDIVLIKPFEVHHTVGVGATEYERILIDFKEPFLNGITDNQQEILNCFNTESNIIRLNVQAQAMVEQILFKMLHENEHEALHKLIYCKLLLVELFILLNRYNDKTKTIKFDYPNDSHKKISEIVQFINESFNEKLTLQDISQQFFISPFYFCRLFKVVIGFSFTQYVNTVRIKEAQRLLRETNMNVSEISGMVGYDNLSHFGRVFKEATGVSPIKYKKTISL